jgi:hypothetical protein
MIASWVCINLLIVTVLTNFDAVMTDTHDGHSALEPIDFDGFAHAWAALTVGVQGSTSVEKAVPALMDNLSKKLEAESETTSVEFVEPTTINFEDAPDRESAELVGTLTVRIQRVDGLAKVGPDLRPYVSRQSNFLFRRFLASDCGLPRIYDALFPGVGMHG